MEQIPEKKKLSKQQILSVCKFFEVGSLKSYHLIAKGNINTNYLIETDQGSFLARLYAFRSEKDVLAEVKLLSYLYLHNFSCQLPIQKKIIQLDQGVIACFKYIPGRELKKITLQSLRIIARLLARLHILTKNYKNRKSLENREGEGLEVIKQYLAAKKNIILRSRFKNSEKFINYLQSEINKLNFPNNLPMGLVHVDIKPENIIIDKNEQINIIDFDNSYIDAFIIDIGSTIMWLCAVQDNINPKLAKIFLQSYNKQRQISEKEKRYLADSIKFNCLKQAFKYAYICLPKLKFAERSADYFFNLYKNLKKFDYD